MNPAISIIVPVYNVELYLERCINSILNQNFSNFELILVNDGSTDTSEEICKNYAEMDSRIKVIIKNNGGLSSARNVGIRESKGDYIGFVDSDDYIDKNMFKILYELCINKKGDISICKFGREIYGELTIEKEEETIFEFNNIESIIQLFNGALYRFSACNKLFKRELFEDITFPEGRIHEDLSTTYRLFSKAKRVIYTNFCGYIYVQRKDSILTSLFNEKRLDAFIGWEEILTFMELKYPHILDKVISCFIYWCMDNVYYILDQVKDRQEKYHYLIRIQQCVKKHYNLIRENTVLSINYRYSIKLFKYNIGLFTFVIFFKRFTNRIL